MFQVNRVNLLKKLILHIKKVFFFTIPELKSPSIAHFPLESRKI